MRKPLVAVLAIVAMAVAAPAAHAAGTPSISASVSSSNTLLGDPVHVTVHASNPGPAYGYNLSYRVVLPAGVTYAGGGPVTPTQIANQPGAGQTTLIFSNVSDLSPSSSFDLGLDLTPSQTTYDAGSSFNVQAEAFVNTDPRFVPKFTATGAPIATSYTGSSGLVSGTQTISAIEVTKDEPSAEGEILRGVHDHQTTYTLTVRDNGVNPTTGVTLDDYLPAGLEFLGCAGTPDHTTNAPTNPGSAQEYPGSGPIVVGAVSNCASPVSVDTVQLDPDGAGPMPNAVYTHVTWSIGTLAAGEVRTISYRAAVPMRANTLTFTGTKPSAASGGQAANLDNNSGPEVTDETQLTNYAHAAGTYQGTTPRATSDSTTLTRTAEDWVVHKSVTPDTLAQGQVSSWTLDFATSEYKFVDDATVTDTLPDGLCPLGATNLTTNNDPADSECNPTGDLPSVPYESAVENNDGTWTLTWDSTVLAKLAHTGVDDSFSITFPTKTRSHYQENHVPAGPILARDTIDNGVTTSGSGFARCTAPGTPDCSTAGPRIAHDGADGATIDDASHAGQTAAPPSIDKKVAASGTNCLTATYVDTVPHYHPGDRVCWRLRVDFPSLVDTSPQALQDFLPSDVTYEPGSEQPTAADNVNATIDESGASQGVLSWTVTGGVVPSGSLVFERVFSTTVTPSTVSDGDISGNLMKFSSTNTPGVSAPLRDQADFQLDAPEVGLTKGVAQVVRGGSTVNGPNPENTDNIAVQGGDQVSYRVDLHNTGTQDALDAQVWDVLPSDYDCTDLGTISDGGSCVDGGVGLDHIVWTVPSLPAGGSHELTYTVTVPADIGPGRSLINHAGVRQYQSATNTGGRFTYTPQSNIDPSDPDPKNAAPADDVSEVHTADAAIAKVAHTEVNEGGNTDAQATIGEEITYTLTATIPAGTTLHGVAQVTDAVDSSTRQPYVPGSASATLNGGALPAGFTLDTSGATPKVIFPADYVNAAGSGDDTVVLTFRTKVADVAANTRLAARLTDTGTLSWTDPVSGAQSRTSQPATSIQIVEPLVSQTKTDNRNPATAAPDDIITYTVRTSNSSAANVSTAHDVAVVDHVPVGLTPIGSAPGNAPLSDGDVVPGSGGAIWNATARTITKTVSTIAPGGNDTYTYRVKVANPAVGGSALTNTVTADATSLGAPFDADGERTSGTGYHATASDTIRIGAATVTKTATPDHATIGDPVTYHVRVTIPASIALYDVTVKDVLPDSIDVDGYGATTCISGCPLVNPVNTYTPAAGPGNNITAAWDLGDIATPLATPQVVELTVLGHVRDTHRGGSAKVLRTQTSINSATVSSNRTDKVTTFDPSTIPTGFDDTSTPATATVTVTEPHLGIDKKVSVDGGPFLDGPATAQAGSTFTYHVQVTNTGDAPAYDVDVSDRPDDELTNVVPAAQSGVSVTDPWTASDPQMGWHIDGPIAPGDSVTLTYTADLVPSSGLHDGQSVDNTAAIPHYFGAPGATRSANPGITYRDYTDGGSDATHVTVDLPTLTTVKTTGAAGFPDTGTAEVGQPFSWRVVVSNTSATAPATNVHVTDTLPANWVYDSGSATLNPGGAQEPGGTGGQLDWTIGSLPAGQSVTITFTAHPTLDARTDPGLGAQANVNSARVTSALDASGGDRDADGPYGTPPDTATATLVAPQLTLDKTPDGGAATAGLPSTFTLNVGNTGTGRARNVDVVDTLPVGLHYTAGTATANPSSGFSETSVDVGAGGQTTIHFEIAALDPSSPVRITLPVDVDASVLDGTTLTNHASVTADEQPEPVGDDGSLDVSAVPDMAIQKTGDPAYTPGRPYTWHLRVRNLGVSDAQDVTVSDPLPSGTTFVSATAPCAESGGTVTCHLGTAAPGFDQTYDVTVDVDPATTASPLDNTATVHTDHDVNSGNDQDTFGPTEAPIADLSVVKTVSPAAILRNGHTTFTLLVHNRGPSVARGVTLTDTLPAGLRYDSADNGACTESGGTVTCPLGDLAPNGDVTVHVTVTGIANGTQTNAADVTSSTPDDPAGDPNHDEADVVVGPATDLELVKTGPATVAAGGTATWTLAVTNHGPDDATGVTISDPLPAGTSLAAADAGCAESGATVTCAVGDLANGDTATRQITLRVPVALADTTVLNSATVDGNQGDPDPTNNESHAGTDVGPAADLAVVKRGPARVDANGTVAWTLVVSNTGPSAATGATVVDTLPAGVQLLSARPTQGSCSAAGGRVTCALGRVARGGAAQVQVVAHVPASRQGATLRNVATVHGDQPDPDPGNDTGAATTAVGPPKATDFDLSIAKTLDPATPPSLGRPMDYLVTVRNSGPATAAGVKVLDTLPSKVKLLSATVPGGQCTHRRAVVTCTLGSLASGASRVIRVRVRPLAGGTLRNTASVSASVADRDPANDSAGVRSAVADPRATLKVVKTASRRSVKAGQRIRYRISVRNTSRHPAADVNVCDRLPKALAYVSAQHARFRRGSACWRVSLLAPGASKHYTLVTRVTNSARSGSLRNVATAQAANAPRRRGTAKVRVAAGGVLPAGGVTG